MKQPTWSGAFAEFKEIVANEFERHFEKGVPEKITGRKMSRIQDVINGTADEQVYFT